MNRAVPFFLLPGLLVGATGCGSMVVIDDPSDAKHLAPKIVATNEALIGTTMAPGLLFTAEAEDPQGSALTFRWEANIGTLKFAESTDTSSSVPWFGPSCLTPGPDPAVIVTVTNRFSLSDTAEFSASSVPPCPTPQDPVPMPVPVPVPIPGPPTKVWNTGGQVDTVVVPAGKTSVQFLVWGSGGGGGAPGGGGGGAWLSAQFLVTAGDKLEVRVGSGGGPNGGGGGASYVLRNGETMLVAAGGGGGGVDGCSGCSNEDGPLLGLGGAGGPAGGAGQNGRANNYLLTNSGGGIGGSQLGGGAGGISNDKNPYGYDECTADGLAGAGNQGGNAVQCDKGGPGEAKGHLGGGGIGNGSGGGGGSGVFGGGSGAAKYTYTGGGGGGGASFIHPNAKQLGTEGGDGQAPGGSQAPGYQDNAGRGGVPASAFGQPSTPGVAGLIIMTL